MDRDQEPLNDADEIRRRLEELFDLVERVDLRGFELDEPYAVYGFGEPDTDSILFRGDALTQLSHLSKLLSANALSGDGIQPDGIRGIIARACHVALSEGSRAGLEAFDSQLNQQARPWLATVATDDRADLDLHIGDCRFSRDWPDHLRNLVSGEEFTMTWLEPPCFTVAVAGKDTESAAVLAMDRVDEVRAVLAIAHVGRVRQGRPALVLSSGDATNTVHAMGAVKTRLWLYGHQDPNVGWLPGLRELGESVARADAERTEWQRRVASAARWALVAQETRWYAQSLVSLMIALECLFVPRRHGSGKGQRIASRASATVVLPGRSRTTQEEWLAELYRRRNEAAHEGLPMEEDLDVEDLIVLVRQLLHWATWHLDPGHANHGPCRSLAEVEDQQLHA
jgi:hypothetical protein